MAEIYFVRHGQSEANAANLVAGWRDYTLTEEGVNQAMKEAQEIERVDIRQLARALQDSWCAKTSVQGDDMPTDNPARGQCVVSSLVVQDYLGGDLFRVKVDVDDTDEKHYYNILDDGTAIDTTRMQYQGKLVTMTPAPVDMKNGQYASVREKVLDDGDTMRRYQLLSKLVASRMENIKNPNK